MRAEVDWFQLNAVCPSAKKISAIAVQFEVQKL